MFKPPTVPILPIQPGFLNGTSSNCNSARDSVSGNSSSRDSFNSSRDHLSSHENAPTEVISAREPLSSRDIPSIDNYNPSSSSNIQGATYNDYYFSSNYNDPAHNNYSQVSQPHPSHAQYGQYPHYSPALHTPSPSSSTSSPSLQYPSASPSPVTTPSPSISPSMSMYQNSMTALLVEELPVDCCEEDLVQIFSPFGKIKSFNIKRGQSKGAYALHCVIDYYHPEHAFLAKAKLHGIFMRGNKLNVQFHTPLPAPTAPLVSSTKNIKTAQVHISYLTKQMNLVVSEHFIRDIFSHFGEVIEVSLKKVCFDAEMSVQNGYGFVHFSISLEGILSALRAVECLHQVTINSISYDCSVSNQLRQVLINIYKGKSNLFSFNHLINAVNNPNNLLAIIGGGFNGQNPNKPGSKGSSMGGNKTPRSNTNTPRSARSLSSNTPNAVSPNGNYRNSPQVSNTTSSTSSYRNYDTLLQFQQQNQFSNPNLPLSARSNYNSFSDFQSDSNSAPLSARSDSSNHYNYNNSNNNSFYGNSMQNNTKPNEVSPNPYYSNFFMYQNSSSPYPTDLSGSSSGQQSYNNSPRTYYDSSYNYAPMPPTPPLPGLHQNPSYVHSPRDEVKNLSNYLEKTSISAVNSLPPPGLSQLNSQQINPSNPPNPPNPSSLQPEPEIKPEELENKEESH